MHALPGTIFAASYEIKRLLGHGSAGPVYVAKQLSTGRFRALKILHEQFREHPGMRDRFTREARIGSSISSERIVEVIDAGIDGVTGLPWLAMELLVGETLRSRLDRMGPMSHKEVALVAEQVCGGLAAAHEKQVVHCNIKPTSIFLREPQGADGIPTAKILDFGIASLLTETESGRQAMETITYGSPEQLEAPARIAPASDVYSLGMTVHEMLAGWAFPPVLRMPARAGNSDGGASGTASGLPKGFGGWFATCTKTDPRERYSDAAQAWSALKPVMESRSPKKVFVSYSHRDTRLCEEFIAHLSVLRRRGVIADWHDRKIIPGQDWAGVIDQNMESADIVVLLVSADFVASNYCYDIELKKAIERKLAGKAELIPVIVRACDWSLTPFSRIQALPREARPVTSWADRDEAWLDVVRGIRATIESTEGYIE